MTAKRMLGGLVFGGLLSFGLVLYATEDHPSALFKEYCAKCHGEDGTANTPKGRQLMAQDFTDPEWQADKTDAKMIKQVTEGGEDMPPFGKKLTKEQIESLVKNDVRGFASKRKTK
ncbi:MAG TPA: cytochrome c [Thermoanaerobaculia bacterium]|nr:cytochrome c [Thermoanaerobaculia bacterium]